MHIQKQIVIKNAHIHNLKNIDVNIPHKKLVVITGVSGSGKTSLAYDTLYAEGYRRYIESLSSYARQFVERLPKPPVDYIKGLSPCIALEQKTITNNPRSTVGTVTEIYDYLRVLFARTGTIVHPVTGKEIKRYHPQDVINFIQNLPPATNLFIAIPIPVSSKFKTDLLNLIEKGFSRILIQQKIFKIAEVLNKLPQLPRECFLLIDRMLLENLDEDTISRITDSVETAFNQSNGICYVITQQNDKWEYHKFSNVLEADGIQFEEPTPQLFAFNNPYGICKNCKGIGTIFDYDIHKVFNTSAPCLEKALKVSLMHEADFLYRKLIYTYPDIFKKEFKDLTPNELQLIWLGTNSVKGLNEILKINEKQLFYTNEQFFTKYKSHQTCHKCNGSRLRQEALYIKINGKTIADFIHLTIEELLYYFKGEIANKIPHKEAVQRLIFEITSRLEFLCNVGLSYLTLNREMRTLSGGEAQRVYLAQALGSSLVGSIYILDEPTTGLHPHDTSKLLSALKRLRDEGNTVVLVEHDEEVIKNADYVIDMGPYAGKNGGEVTFQGDIKQFQYASTLTHQYVYGKKTVQINNLPRNNFEFIYLKNASANNLKNIDIQFPFNAITCITGVSGSGKSTLVEEELVPELEKVIIHLTNSSKISGVVKKIKQIHFISQNSISTSSRSNCATYTKMYDYIRLLFSIQANQQGFKLDPSYFSFNTPGGRCEKCLGEGVIQIPMQFMADIEMPCDECHGKRFKKEILQVKYFNKTISDILEMTVDEAYQLFIQDTYNKKQTAQIIKALEILKSVGLGYINLGQSTSKMSGGELQRLKIATFLQEETKEPSLFIFDEPSTGLHFYDIDILMKTLHQLILRGHTILIIEHQLDIIKNADWIIDLGPEGGKNGGYVVFQGTINDFLHCKNSYTAHFLQNKLTVKTNLKITRVNETLQKIQDN